MSNRPAGRRHIPLFFLEPGALDGPDLAIGGEDARHLAVVRRAAPGDLITVGDGRGRQGEARLRAVAPGGIQAVVESIRSIPRPRPSIEVYQGLAKGEKVEAVIRQLVELGVDRVVIFAADRSVARWEPSRAAAARTRWEAVAREAAKQSHRAWFPELAGPMTLAEAAADARAGGGLGLVAHPDAPDSLAGVLAAPGTGTEARVWLAVGPEGGFSSPELAALAGAGARPVSLGRQILRTESAGLALAAVVMYRLGRFGHLDPATG